MNSRKIYLIPGLANDGRVFSRLKLPDGEKVFLEWIEPEEDESFSSYAARMAEQIKDDEKNIIIGFSFGGLLSIEIAKLKDIDQNIIISSVKSDKEKPFPIKLLDKLPYLRLSRSKATRERFVKLGGAPFGLGSKESQELFLDMMNSQSPQLRAWSIKQISQWKNKFQPKKLVHIHGDRDLVFPHIWINDAYLVKGGDHFAIYNKAEEVSRIIEEQILD